MFSHHDVCNGSDIANWDICPGDLPLKIYINDPDQSDSAFQCTLIFHRCGVGIDCIYLFI